MTSEDAQDRALEEAMGGDIEALVGLLESVAPSIRAIVEPKIGRKHRSMLTVDDVMQVTYMEAISRFGAFSGGGSRGFRAWVARIAENNLIDAVRGLEAAKRPNPSKRIENRSQDDSMVAMVEAIGVTVSTPSLVAHKGEVVSVIQRAVSRLPDDYARVITMYDLQGRSIDEVVQELGRSKGAVYMLRARAHEHLKEVLGSESRYFTRVE
ncbi:MAG: RNA polymerase sigma factor [Planctomycetota bacterium]